MQAMTSTREHLPVLVVPWPGQLVSAMCGLGGDSVMTLCAVLTVGICQPQGDAAVGTNLVVLQLQLLALLLGCVCLCCMPLVDGQQCHLFILVLLSQPLLLLHSRRSGLLSCGALLLCNLSVLHGRLQQHGMC